MSPVPNIVPGNGSPDLPCVSPDVHPIHHRSCPPLPSPAATAILVLLLSFAYLSSQSLGPSSGNQILRWRSACSVFNTTLYFQSASTTPTTALLVRRLHGRCIDCRFVSYSNLVHIIAGRSVSPVAGLAASWTRTQDAPGVGVPRQNRPRLTSTPRTSA